MQLVRDRLDQSIAQSRRSDITYPHTGKSRDEHQNEENDAWFRSCCVENPGRGHDIQSCLGEHRGDCETSNQKHDCRREHLREDVPIVSRMRGRARITHFVPSAAVNLVSFPSEDLRTRRNTTRSGTEREVTKSGIAYVSELPCTDA